MSSTPPRLQQPVGRGLLVLALALLALHLRAGASSVGPVLREMQVDLGFSSAFSGVLTALPGLGFATVGLVAGALGARIGLSRSLLLAMCAIGFGLLGRAFAGDQWTFVALTALAVAGMAVGNVLAPPFIKAHFARPTPQMTLYIMLLSVSAMLPAVLGGWALSLPGGWRTALGIWGATALLSTIPWAIVVLRERRSAAITSTTALSPETSRPHVQLRMLLRSGTAVALALFFGLQSMSAYVMFGWMAGAYRAGGLDAASAGAWTGLYLGLGIPAGLVMPSVVARVKDLRPAMVVFGATGALGFAALLYAPTTPWLAAVLLGIGSGAFPTAIALITTLTRDHKVTLKVSAFAQSVGYAFAAIGPVLVGLSMEVFGRWEIPLLGLAATSVIMAGAGIRAVSGKIIDDELPHPLSG